MGKERQPGEAQSRGTLACTKAYEGWVRVGSRSALSLERCQASETSQKMFPGKSASIVLAEGKTAQQPSAAVSASTRFSILQLASESPCTLIKRTFPNITQTLQIQFLWEQMCKTSSPLCVLLNTDVENHMNSRMSQKFKWFVIIVITICR